MQDGRSTIRIALIALLILGIGGYGLFQARKVIEGPVIRVDQPLDGGSTDTAELTVRGKAQNIAFMYLNGRKIFTDDNGVFSENLVLFPGQNVIELKAEDKFGKSTGHWIRIYRKI